MQQDTLELMLKVQLDAPNTLNILSEYRLRLSALVNQYLETKASYDDESTQTEQDKNEVNSKPINCCDTDYRFVEIHRKLHCVLSFYLIG